MLTHPVWVWYNTYLIVVCVCVWVHDDIRSVNQLLTSKNIIKSLYSQLCVVYYTCYYKDDSYTYYIFLFLTTCCIMSDIRFNEYVIRRLEFTFGIILLKPSIFPLGALELKCCCCSLFDYTNIASSKVSVLNFF